MSKTNIGWTNESWNPLTWNCKKVSPGCKNCYAEALAKKQPQRSAGRRFHGRPVLRSDYLQTLAKIRKGAVVFTCSMSDLMEAELPAIVAIWKAMQSRPDCTFLCLTKRPQVAWDNQYAIPETPNIWLGTSIESPRQLWRAQYLLATDAAGRFLSVEPLLEDLTTDPQFEAYLMPEPRLTPADNFPPIPEGRRIEWVIVGGESGPNRREFKKGWALNILEICERHNVPFFFKQGGHRYPGQDRDLNGQTYDQTPEFKSRPEPEPKDVKLL